MWPWIVGLGIAFLILDKSARSAFNTTIGRLMVHGGQPSAALPAALPATGLFPSLHPGHLYTFVANSMLGATEFGAELAVVGALVQGPLAGTGQAGQWSGVFQWMGVDNEPVENLQDVTWISVAEVSPGGTP